MLIILFSVLSFKTEGIRRFCVFFLIQEPELVCAIFRKNLKVILNYFPPEINCWAPFWLDFECESFNLLCLQRQKIMFFCIFMLQNAKSSFFQVAATALGPIPLFSSRNLVQIPLSESSVGASCVELWRLHWSIRISVPMLYITF